MFSVGRSDLHVSGAVLDEVRAALASVSVTLDEARRRLASADAAVAGAPPLVEQAETYAASWQYGITQLGQHAKQCLAELAKVAAAFEETDRRLAAALPPVRGAGVAEGAGPVAGAGSAGGSRPGP